MIGHNISLLSAWVFFHTLTIHEAAEERRDQLYSSLTLPFAHDYSGINLKVHSWNDYCVFLMAVHGINYQAVTWWDWTTSGNKNFNW